MMRRDLSGFVPGKEDYLHTLHSGNFAGHSVKCAERMPWTTDVFHLPALAVDLSRRGVGVQFGVKVGAAAKVVDHLNE
jgi:hypothetical protein